MNLGAAGTAKADLGSVDRNQPEVLIPVQGSARSIEADREQSSPHYYNEYSGQNLTGRQRDPGRALNLRVDYTGLETHKDFSRI